MGFVFYLKVFSLLLKFLFLNLKNQLLGTSEIGFNAAKRISERLKEARNVAARLDIIENELASLLDDAYYIPKKFQQLFNTLKQNDNSQQIAEFCQRQNIGMRKLERLYNKYIGIPAKTYGTLDRFQSSFKQTSL